MQSTQTPVGVNGFFPSSSGERAFSDGAPLAQDVAQMIHFKSCDSILRGIPLYISLNASGRHFAPEWLLWNSFTSWTFYCGWLETANPKNSWSRLPETRHHRRTCPDQSYSLLARCRSSRPRAPDCCRATSSSSSIWSIICIVVLRGKPGGRLGQSRVWRWLLCSSRSAQECAADSGRKWCIRCDLGRWVSGCLGQSRRWRWLFRSSRSDSAALKIGDPLRYCYVPRRFHMGTLTQRGMMWTVRKQRACRPWFLFGLTSNRNANGEWLWSFRLKGLGTWPITIRHVGVSKNDAFS